MEDLSYIVGIGFSGADIARALIIAFFLAMLAGKKRNIWLVGLAALFLDRFVWPIVGMAVSGAGVHSIYASIGALFMTFPADLGLYVVRYVGLTIMIAGFVGIRTWIHTLKPLKKSKPAAA
ncbi:MAG: hypothetical protein AB7P23_09200 [Amphiplicatus sp.]